MNITKTQLPGLLLLSPKLFEDKRGYFFESYNQNIINEAGVPYSFVQDNQSLSGHGVIRGLHYQLNPQPQTKIVRVLHGTIYDVAVDIRQGSPTYGKWLGFELSADNKKQLLIPRGFAHGFSVLSEQAEIIYKCDGFYAPDCDAGIRFDDPFLNINWQIEKGKAILSEKDASLPDFREAKNNFTF